MLGGTCASLVFFRGLFGFAPPRANSGCPPPRDLIPQADVFETPAFTWSEILRLSFPRRFFRQWEPPLRRVHHAKPFRVFDELGHRRKYVTTSLFHHEDGVTKVPGPESHAPLLAAVY